MKMCPSYRMKTATMGIIFWMILINLVFACTNDFPERLPSEKGISKGISPLKPNIRFSLEFSSSSFPEDNSVNNQLLIFNGNNILEASGSKEPKSDNKLIEDQKKFLESLKLAAVFQYELVPNLEAIKPFYLKCIENCKSGSAEIFYVAAQADGQLTLQSDKQNATKFYSDGENELIKSGYYKEAVDKFNDGNLALKAWPVLDQKVTARWRQFCLKKPLQKTEETSTCGEFVTENAERASYEPQVEAPYSYLTIATYGCKKKYGFSKTNNNPTQEKVMCVKGTWKAFDRKQDNEPSIRWREPETCKPRSCANNINPINAGVNYTANDPQFTENGSQATITCNSGYFFTTSKQTILASTGNVICNLGDWEEWNCEKGCDITGFPKDKVEMIEMTDPKDCINNFCKIGGIATMHCKIHDESEMKEFQEINPKIPDGYNIPKFVTEDLESSGQTTCEPTGWKNICTQKVLIKNSANDKPDKVAL